MNRPEIKPIKPTSELGYDTDAPPPTKENWEAFRNDNYYAQITGGYIDGMYDMLQMIEKVITVEDLSQMKTELTQLYMERHEFMAYAISHP